MTPESPSRLAIATPQAPATEAGLAAFEAGGNALDAALAAALSLTVAYPNNCALGGDLIAIVCLADGATRVVNASGPAPAAVDAGRLLAADWIPIRGPDPVTVPGLLAGLGAIAELGAQRSWESQFEAAIGLAEDGFAVPPTLAAAIAGAAADLEADEGCRQVYFESGSPLRAGELLRQPALARTLRRIAAEGPAVFYGGELGAELVAFLRGAGSPISLADLAGFAPEVGPPLLADLDDGQTIATAPPNSQGFVLPLILQAPELREGPVDPLGAGASALAGAFARGLAIREERLCDPAALSGGGDTVAVVTADDAGNSVSLLQSVFHGFGAALLDPATGVLFHNRGACFSADPDSPNAIAAGRRPAHTLMPCMVLADGRPTIVVSTMGGSGQPQILAEIILRLRAGDSAAAALDAPRWVLSPGAGGDIAYEPRLPAAAREALAATGRPLRAIDDYADESGHAQLILIGDRPDRFEAASDPRSEGAAAVTDRGRPSIRLEG